TVSFHPNGGTGTMDNQSFTHDTEQELSPNAFAREGYTFSGWKDGSDNYYLNGASVTATDNMILTAQWTPTSYSIKFDANGGTGSISNQSFTYGTAQNLTNNSLTRTGYTFAGWNTKADGNGTPYGNGASVQDLSAVTGETVTLYARWTANSYTVNFNANGGTGSMAAQQLTYDETRALSINAFTKTGYSFAGWNTAENGSGTSYADRTSVKNLATEQNGTVPLYAMWTADAYTLTFAANSGTGSMANQSFATGDTSALRTNAFTKAGYSFTGWKNDGNAPVAADATVNTVGRSTSLTAQWTANSYTVHFNANGGTGSMADQSFTYGTAHNLTANSMTRMGYSFAGWSDSPMATTATYQDNQSVSNLTSIKDAIVTLYAVWTADAYTVTYSANGGEGLIADSSFTNGVGGTLTLNAFTRTGYRFSGWNTHADATGSYFADGASVSFTPDSTGIVVLYAMWTEAARYNLSGAVTDDTSPTPLAVSGAAVTLKQGGTVIASTETDASGAYNLLNILPGTYNLVTAKGGKTVTRLVTVTQADVTADITLPNAGTTSSVLFVESDDGETPPRVVVGGLDDLAEAGTENITMTVTAKAADESSTQQSAIRTAAGNQTSAQFLDIVLMRGATDIGDANNTVLEIVLPFNFSGRNDVKVWRYHGGASEELTKLETKPSAPFADGTFFSDSQNGLIYVYAEKFSTYAVTYQQFIPSSGGVTSDYSVTVNSAEGGAIKTDKSSAASGTKVTVTVTPDAGYTLKSLSVTDVNGKSITCTDCGNGSFTFIMPISSVTVSAKFERSSKNPFVDVAESSYYYDAVLWAVEKGVTTGTGTTTFSPDLICTRAQTVTFLWRAMGSPEPTNANSPFTDVVSDAYYYKAVLWATEKGITIGTSSTTFSPNDTVTRGQTVTFLWRTAGKPTVTSTNPFCDVQSDDYYADAVLWAVSGSVTTGTGAAAFSPADGCTRAQIVTFLYRYLSR
ncbi:MAG: InlB B-repeat-containing protein, partial [Oscillospiraceae bacterium]|nr:InlB B-repeat-containing protein [Oscillospiraceae bacterium]